MIQSTWPAVSFMINLVIVVGLGLFTALLLVGLLYTARFFRLENVRQLWAAEPPSFREVAATLKIFGQEVAANARLDDQRDQQLVALEDRVERMERSMKAQQEATRLLVAHVKSSGSKNG